MREEHVLTAKWRFFIHKHKSHSYIRIITIKPFLNHRHYYIITVCHPKQILREKNLHFF